MSESNQDKKGFVTRMLNVIEKIGNKLPDPAILFFISLVLVWVISAFMAPIEFSDINPRTGEAIKIQNLLTGDAMANFLANMVNTFTSFAPLGVVLVAMLGVGVADGSGYINTGLKMMLSKTPKALLTPMVIFVGIISHSAIDAGYVLVIPLGGIIFYAAGRHPLAGIAAAFAGVSGGFSANPLPSALDPLLQGFTQPAAQIIDGDIQINPLCNYYFTACSSILVTLLGWYITDKIIEPRLKRTAPVDDDIEAAPDMSSISAKEKKGFWLATLISVALFVLFSLTLLPEDSPFRDADGKISSFSAPIMQSIVPLIFIFFLLPGVIYGYFANSYQKSKDVIDDMSKAMEGMAYYIVMAFFCALFINAFASSNLGALLAIKGATALKALSLPGPVTIAGIIFLTGFVNLFVGSASAKWALLAPIFVPMLMQLGYSAELTQAAYRVGDSSTNIITPLMPYFPLVVVFCQRYFKKTGIGTLVSIMIPYSIALLIIWTIFLVIFWVSGVPLGLQASYIYG
ncbi:MAG: AbgT family transporter [Saprospiraceae bacterium]|nr:AbgT family transporter [Saprospiraceae bacterium]